ncbi:major capsid protein [Anaerosinus massiliensis]|uniref:major capsid protein n=1 Tax=Massilibacillus massiliensis TaxID=1806837 RepID=UPI000AD1B479|nr:major capsid protein [Massilibacillus massiliensis]
MADLQTFMGFPYVPEIFDKMWLGYQDPVLTAMLDSGALVADSHIASLIAEEGLTYTTRFDDKLTGTPGNYDGGTDVPLESTTASFMTGVVYGRTQGWTERDFKAVISGHDPFPVISGQIGKFWKDYRQALMIKILGAIKEVTGTGKFASWSNHIVNDAATAEGGTARLINATDLNNLATAALGDNKSKFKLAVMHSSVAKTLENLQVLEYWKQTDANGVQRPTGIASANGYTVVIDDGVPVVANETTDLNEYTTYLLGEGVLRYAAYNLGKKTSGVQRDEVTNGGQETLVTRIRETIHPNGFSYKIPATTTLSPTDAQLANKAQWSLAVDPKLIPIAMLTTNG